MKQETSINQVVILGLVVVPPRRGIMTLKISQWHSPWEDKIYLFNTIVDDKAKIMNAEPTKKISENNVILGKGWIEPNYDQVDVKLEEVCLVDPSFTCDMQARFIILGKTIESFNGDVWEGSEEDLPMRLKTEHGDVTIYLKNTYLSIKEKTIVLVEGRIEPTSKWNLRPILRGEKVYPLFY